MPVTIHPNTLKFLKELSANNNRDWFNAHKNQYLAAHENMIAFAGALLQLMQQHDHIETPTGKDSLMRIYRDTRFSKDKTPYRTNFGGGFKRVKPLLRGGYYFQVGPGQSIIAGGFFSPNPADLQRIRQDMDYNYTDWQKILNKKTIQHNFGALYGEKLASAPRGYDRDHPAIQLLRHKQLYLRREFTDAEVLSPGFLGQLNQGFKHMRPWFDYMSDVLTTDANGERVV